MACGHEVYTAIQATNLLRDKHPDLKIQISAISYLNLLTSNNNQHRILINRLVPSGIPIIRLAGLSPDALGISHGFKEITLCTQYITQSCSQEELSCDQGYNLETVILTAERLLGSRVGGHK
jgi:hypothetical protein